VNITAARQPPELPETCQMNELDTGLIVLTVLSVLLWGLVAPVIDHDGNF